MGCQLKPLNVRIFIFVFCLFCILKVTNCTFNPVNWKCLFIPRMAVQRPQAGGDIVTLFNTEYSTGSRGTRHYTTCIFMHFLGKSGVINLKWNCFLSQSHTHFAVIMMTSRWLVNVFPNKYCVIETLSSQNLNLGLIVEINEVILILIEFDYWWKGKLNNIFMLNGKYPRGSRRIKIYLINELLMGISIC